MRRRPLDALIEDYFSGMIIGFAVQRGMRIAGRPFVRFVQLSLLLTPGTHVNRLDLSPADGIEHLIRAQDTVFVVERQYALPGGKRIPDYVVVEPWFRLPYLIICPHSRLVPRVEVEIADYSNPGSAVSPALRAVKQSTSISIVGRGRVSSRRNEQDIVGGGQIALRCDSAEAGCE